MLRKTRASMLSYAAKMLASFEEGSGEGMKTVWQRQARKLADVRQSRAMQIHEVNWRTGRVVLALLTSEPKTPRFYVDIASLDLAAGDLVDCTLDEDSDERLTPAMISNTPLQRHRVVDCKGAAW